MPRSDPALPGAQWRASFAGLAAAGLWGIADVTSKLVFLTGAGALTVATLRGVVAIIFMLVWMGLTPAAVALSRRDVAIALFLGVLFAGNVLGVYTALASLPVPIAILAYFIYPLLTGIAGAVLGLERLELRGGAVALVAFGGLALMIGASPTALDPLGLLAAFAGAAMRVAMLLLTRARLARADVRLTTWYSSLSSTVVLAALLLATHAWQPPVGTGGIAVFVLMAVTSAAGVAAMLASAARIGAFRTALLMNFEPVISTIGAMVVLGDTLTLTQYAGAAIMVTALCAFQLAR